MKKLFTALALALVALAPARAVPQLQIDIAGGTYDATTETTVTSSPTFTLYALLDSLSPVGPYYISAALFPSPSAAGGNYGSFVVNGVTVNATSGMTYGTPSNMPPHGIYPAWYKEFSFTFDTANKFSNYDVQGVVGTHNGPTDNDATGNALYMPFSVDVTNLAEGTELVFDLYTYEQSGKQVKIKFAPFSHNGGTTPGNSVPDGSTTLILIGLAGVAFTGARRFIRA